jgi:hypothetical protein
LFGAGYANGVPTSWLVAGYSQNELNVRAPEVVLPTLEFEWFGRRGNPVVLSIPINDIVLFLPLTHLSFYTTDIYYDFNFGRGIARGIVGPGGGFAIGSVAGSLRLPVEGGLELLNKNESFGFKLLARPYAEMLFNHQDVEGGGGATFLIGFFGYPHKQQKVDQPVWDPR